MIKPSASATMSIIMRMMHCRRYTSLLVGHGPPSPSFRRSLSGGAVASLSNLLSATTTTKRLCFYHTKKPLYEMSSPLTPVSPKSATPLNITTRGISLLVASTTTSNFPLPRLLAVIHRHTSKMGALRLPAPLQLQQQCRTKHTFKTNRSVAKRFRVKGNGDLIRSRSGAQHNTGYRSRGKINQLGQSAPIKNKKLARKMKMCVGGL